jgi:predicted RecA/RadA family phage recombinase
MATDKTTNYEIPFPKSTDFVNVHGDLEDLANKIDTILPSASYSQLAVLNNSGVTIDAGDPVYVTGYTTKTTVARATSSTTQAILGLAKTDIPNGDSGIIVVSGILENINTSSFTAGDILYAGASGGLTTTQDVGGAVGIVAYAAETGLVIVEAKGNGTWGALKAGLA